MTSSASVRSTGTVDSRSSPLWAAGGTNCSRSMFRIFAFWNMEIWQYLVNIPNAYYLVFCTGVTISRKRHFWSASRTKRDRRVAKQKRALLFISMLYNCDSQQPALPCRFSFVAPCHANTSGLDLFCGNRQIRLHSKFKYFSNTLYLLFMFVFFIFFLLIFIFIY